MSVKNKLFSCIALLLVVVLLFAGCGKSASDKGEEVVKGEVVATVGDTPIYDYEVQFYALYFGTTADQALETLIGNIRVLNFANENGIEVSEEKIAETKKSLDDEKEQYKEDYEAFLTSMEITEEQYRVVVINSLKYQTAFESLTDLNVLEGFGKEDVDKYYNDNFLRAKHVLIAFTDAEGNERGEDEALKLAKDVQKRLNDGESMDKLVAELSEDPGSQTSPDGYVFLNTAGMDDETKNTLGQSGAPIMVDEFTKGTADLEMEEVSEPIKTDYGYHVIQRLDINEEGIYDANKSVVLAAMSASDTEAYTKANDDFMKTLEEKYASKTNEDILKVITEKVDAKLAEMMQQQAAAQQPAVEQAPVEEAPAE